MQKPILPTQVDFEGESITILWDDGHRSPYPHRFLRLRCPCASCVDEMTGRPTLVAESVPEDIHAVDHMPVGNYGMQFLWSDAHYTGIYTFVFLRQVCTCIACGEERAGAGPTET